MKSQSEYQKSSKNPLDPRYYSLDPPLEHERITNTFGLLPKKTSIDFLARDRERAKELLLGIRLQLANS